MSHKYEVYSEETIVKNHAVSLYADILYLELSWWPF